MMFLPYEVVTTVYEFDPTYKVDHYKRVVAELKINVEIIRLIVTDALNLVISERYMKKTLRFLNKKNIKALARFTTTPLPKRFTKRRGMLSIIFNVLKKQDWLTLSFAFEK